MTEKTSIPTAFDTGTGAFPRQRDPITYVGAGDGEPTGAVERDHEPILTESPTRAEAVENPTPVTPPPTRYEWPAVELEEKTVTKNEVENKAVQTSDEKAIKPKKATKKAKATK